MKSSPTDLQETSKGQRTILVKGKGNEIQKEWTRSTLPQVGDFLAWFKAPSTDQKTLWTVTQLRCEKGWEGAVQSVKMDK